MEYIETEGKSQQSFRTIGEVAADIGIPTHVLRFWESKFVQIKPHKRRGGHRYYRQVDVDLLQEIKSLLYERGYTIKGAQKHLKEARNTKEEIQKDNNKESSQRSLFDDKKDKKYIAENTKNIKRILTELVTIKDLLNAD